MTRPLLPAIPSLVPPPGWHVAILGCLAVSHPIAAVLVRGPEFFVAHDLGRVSLVLLAAGLFAGVPAVLWLLTVGARRLHAGAGRLFAFGLLFALVTLLAAQVLKRAGLDGDLTLPGAALAGAAATWLYGRFAAARLFVSVLAPAPVVAAIVFFASSPVAALMRTPAAPAGAEAGRKPPVVILVFDQLPLLSLLDDERGIDRRRFPNFAALAEVATWYRNTTAAATLTNWALPALLTGRYPQADLLPAAVDHPGSLFALLASTHRFHVVEPITALCPARLCPAPGGITWTALAADLAVVYGHIALPTHLSSSLPSVTHNWRGFGFDFWQRRWVDERDDDRQRSVLQWIDGVEAPGEPVVHLLHVLLPHEPYLYLPNGQLGRPGGEPLGLERFGIWSDDERLVALAYQQHLWQVQFVDRLLGLVMDRLKAVGLFDAALLVVTSDHGAAFRPQRPFKQPVASTLAEIAAIPLFVKAPGGRSGRVDDQPLQAIDVLPTIAYELGVEIPWPVEGRAAQRGSPIEPDARRLYRDRAERFLTFSSGEFEQSMRAGEARKWAAVDPDPAVVAWPGDPGRHLIGTPVADLDVETPPVLGASIDEVDVFAIVDPDGPYVPAFVSGVVEALDGTSSALRLLAVSVNGVVRATAQPGRRPVAGRDGFWAALVPPGAYREGQNDVTLFEVLSTSPPRLRAVAVETTGDGPGSVNLLAPAVETTLGIEQRGFYATEAGDSGSYRWTDGDASLTVPIDPERPPRELELTVFGASDAAQMMAVRVNDCLVFEGSSTVPPVKRLPLAPCDPLGSELTIAVTSGTVVPGPDDARPLGVAFESIRLR